MKAVGLLFGAVLGASMWGCGGAPLDAGPGIGEDLQVGRMLGGGGEAEGFAEASSPRPFRFPEDHGAHPAFRSEWWYLTFALEAIDGDSAVRSEGGTPSSRSSFEAFPPPARPHSTASAGFRASETPTRTEGSRRREFGVQFTLFRRALFAGGDPADPWRNGQAYLAHFALTDVAAGTHRHAERLARGHPDLAGAEVADGRAVAWLEDWRLVMGDDGWTLRAAEPSACLGLQGDARQAPDRCRDGFAADLAMLPDKGFVPQGDGGLSAKGPGEASHYYSAPRLRTEGQLVIDGESHSVAGRGWLDREWSTSALSPQQVGWDWFALMLDSGEDVMAFRLRRRDGSRDPYDHGAWIGPDGAVRLLSANDFQLTPIGQWQDEEGRRWPTRWRLAVGERRFEIAAALDDQRMDTLLTYWEGLVRVADAQGRQVGRGYMELTGY